MIMIVLTYLSEGISYILMYHFHYHEYLIMMISGIIYEPNDYIPEIDYYINN